MAEGLCNMLVGIEKSLQSMNDLDKLTSKVITVAAINGRTAYHFLFVDCCFNVFIYDRFQDTTT